MNADEKSPVAGVTKSAPYLSCFLIGIIALILGRGFFLTPFHPSEKNKTPAIQPANSATFAATPLNLDISQTDYAASLPVLPIKKHILPPSSVLPKSDTKTADLSQQGLQMRLKSPTTVYNINDHTSVVTDTNRNTSAGNDVNSNFLQQAGNAPVVTVSAKQNRHMNDKILQGKLMTAVLETAVNSDLPGMVRAVITKDIYSDTGKVILLPKGTRLIGQYSANLAAGQTRVMVAWTRAITPDYLDIALASPSTDELGQTGATGDVDTHFLKIFGTSALLSVLGIVSSNTNTTASTNSGGIYSSNYQMAVSQGMLNNSNNILQSRINIQPSIHIQQGTAIQIFVARDLDFSAISTMQYDT